MEKFVSLIFLSYLAFVASLEPLTTGAIVGATAVTTAGIFGYISCHFYVCCAFPYIKNNVTEFQELFDKNVFGQHLVRDVVSKSLRSHLRKIEKSESNPNRGPSKALVLSFHGWTGTGKNYVAKFLAESLYKDGLKSQFVHKFISTLDFPLESQTDIYKLNLQDWIRGNVSQCRQSLFIFDEIDKMHEGLIDAIKPFIDYHESINGVDFRKSIFVFLSNTGGSELTRFATKAWETGMDRKDFRLEQVEELVQQGAFNEAGGLHQSTLITKSLVDHYVPFLPLQREHVIKCAKVEASRQEVTLSEDEITKIADEMHYWPESTKIFSKTGCKRVSQKVGFIIEEKDILG